MTRDPVTVGPDQNVSEALEKMRAGGFRRLPVVANDRLVGILTDHDIARQLSDASRTKISGIMNSEPVTVTPNTPLEDAARILIRRKIGGLPVIEDDRLVGVITTTDVIDALLDVMGVYDEHTCRIDLTFNGGPQDLANATRILEESGGEVLGMGSFREKWRKAPVFFLRARCPEVGRAAQLLKAAGYVVLAVHTGPEGIRA